MNNTFQYPKCLDEFNECDFNYVLKMNIQDDIGELGKFLAFEGPANALLGVTTKDLQLLLTEPDVAQDIFVKVINYEFLM